MLEDYETYNKVKVHATKKIKDLKPAPVASMSSKPPAYVKVSPAVLQKGETHSHHSKKKHKNKSKVYRSSSPKQIDSNGNPDPGDSSSSSSDIRHPKRSKKSKEDDESDSKDSKGNYYEDEDMPGHGDYKRYQAKRDASLAEKNKETERSLRGKPYKARPQFNSINGKA
jgi:hypothetical protein